MRSLKLSSLDSFKIKIQVVNKQEIIHEEVNEDEHSSGDSDDDDEDDVFEHKDKLRNKASTGVPNKHSKKPSMGELKVNIEGPIRVGANMAHQRAPQSATQPKIKGLQFVNPAHPSGGFDGRHQPYSPTYPGFQQPFVPGGPMTSKEMTMNTINQQLMSQKPMQYQMPLYPAHQPQSAGLARKPPGFEFMTPKPLYPAYTPPEYPGYQYPAHQPQVPYYPNLEVVYSKQPTSPLVPQPGYDLTRLKKQPQSATMAPSKNKLQAPIDTQESRIFEWVKKCEAIEDFDKRMEFLEGKLCEMLFTQTGSRFIQKQLGEDTNQDETDMDVLKTNKKLIDERIHIFTSFILSEIGEKVNEIMIDRYGNYFFQELIRKCDAEQRLSIFQNINANFIQICTDKKGTHTVQKLIDMVNTPEEEKALNECIDGQVVRL